VSDSGKTIRFSYLYLCPGGHTPASYTPETPDEVVRCSITSKDVRCDKPLRRIEEKSR